MNLTNQVNLLTQLSYSPSAPTGFADGDTFSMEQNDGVFEDGVTIFEVDEFDKELLEGAEDADTIRDS